MEFCPKCGGMLLSNGDELKCGCGYTKDLPQMTISPFQKKFNELKKIKEKKLEERRLKEETMYLEHELIIDDSKCKGVDCIKCINACPWQNLTFNKLFFSSNSSISISVKDDCSFCGRCEKACPEQCLKIEEKWIKKLTFDEWYEIECKLDPNFKKIDHDNFPRSIFNFKRKYDAALMSITYHEYGEFENRGENGYFTEYFTLSFACDNPREDMFDYFSGGYDNEGIKFIECVEYDYYNPKFYFKITVKTEFNELYDVYEYDNLEEKYEEYVPRY